MSISPMTTIELYVWVDYRYITVEHNFRTWWDISMSITVVIHINLTMTFFTGPIMTGASCTRFLTVGFTGPRDIAMYITEIIICWVMPMVMQMHTMILKDLPAGLHIILPVAEAMRMPVQAPAVNMPVATAMQAGAVLQGAMVREAR